MIAPFRHRDGANVLLFLLTIRVLVWYPTSARACRKSVARAAELLTNTTTYELTAPRRRTLCYAWEAPVVCPARPRKLAVAKPWGFPLLERSRVCRSSS